jgi:hypothetical protein
MLECIDRQQRNKLKLDNLSLPSPERHRPLRHQYSSDNMNVPPFNIPNLRIDQRKTSSAEDMARKNSTGSISNEIFFLLFPSLFFALPSFCSVIYYRRNSHQTSIQLYQTLYYQFISHFSSFKALSIPIYRVMKCLTTVSTNKTFCVG